MAPAADDAPAAPRAIARPALRLLLQALLVLAIIGAIQRVQQAPGRAGPGTVAIRWDGAADDGRPPRWDAADRQRGQREYCGRFSLDGPAPASPVLRVHGVGSRIAAAELNGLPLRFDGDPDAARQRFRPLQADLPAGALRPGGNALRLVVAADPPGSGYLGQVELGDRAALPPPSGWRSPRVGAVVVLVALVLGSVSLLLALGRRRDGLFLAHAVICAAGSLFVAGFLIGDPPLPGPWWDSLHALAAIVVVAGGDVLGRCYVDDPPRPSRRLLAGLGAVLLGLAAAIAVLPDAWVYGGLIPALVAANIAAGTWRLGDFWVRRVLPRPEWTSFWMFLSVQLVAVAGVHDSLLLVGAPLTDRLPWLDPGDGLYLPLAVIVPLAVFTRVVLQRYLDALRVAETLNRELSDRVAQREQEIARSYAALHRVERAHAAAEERERLLADMHDGLGGTLVAALARLDNERAGESPAARAMRAALDDLRLILDSSDPVHGSLRAVLAQLRERLEAVCEDAGIALEFPLDAVPDTVFWPPRAALNLLRIIQEACSNAIRHGRPTRLRVAIGLEGDGRLRATIEDDGQGFVPQAAQPTQRGLANLRRRAAHLGGEIRWLPLAPGTRVALDVPPPARP